MLPLAAQSAVPVPGGAGDECGGARDNVRLLLVVRNGGPAQVEKAGDGCADCAIRVQLCGVGSDAVLPLHRIRVLRDRGLVLQCCFQCLSFGSFCGLSCQELRQ